MQKIALVFVAFVSAVGALAELEPQDWTDGDLVVQKGHVVTAGVEQQGKTNTSINVHGKLVIATGSSTAASKALVLLNGSNPKTSTENSLGADLGDEGEIVVDNGYLYGYYESSPYDNWTIGENGGNGRFVVGGAAAGNVYFQTLTLATAAATTAARFEPLVIKGGSTVTPKKIYNKNSKPMQITFTNDVGVTTRPKLQPFYGAVLFNMTQAGGDIILQGCPRADIYISGWSGAGFNMIATSATDRKACVRTEGDCNVEIQIGRSWAMLNATNVVWGHAGDTIVNVTTYSEKYVVGANPAKPYHCLRTKVDRVLPSGPQTGILRLYSNYAGYPLECDFYGTDQDLNGLVAGANVKFLSTNGVSHVTFGKDDTDGVFGGDLSDVTGTVTYEKVGSGTLAISNLTVSALTVTGGTLTVVGGTVNTIGTLAITNATLTIAPDAVLNVDNWVLGENVTYALPSVGASNVFASVSTPSVAGLKMVKRGDNFLTCPTPVDAAGMELVVEGGVLRMGGEACTNDYWRFIAKKASIEKRIVTANDKSVEITLFLGTLGLWNPDGLPCVVSPAATNDAWLATALLPGHCSSANVFAKWSNAIGKAYFGLLGEKDKDPVLTGASATPPYSFLDPYEKNETTNRYDGNDEASRLRYWHSGMMFTNKVLNVADSGTWETITWRRHSSWRVPATSYSMQRLTNIGRASSPVVTDWELQSSPTGEDGTWVTMDERSGELPWESNDPGSTGLNAGYYFTYNNHKPYLFRSRNGGWAFSTFGKVSVFKGATLELDDIPTENIAFNALEVDLTAGAGTITTFRPAANGTLYLVNPKASDRKDGVLKPTVTLPLTFGAIVDGGNLASWTVYVDGVRSKDSVVRVFDGQLVVKTPCGLVIIFR